MRERGSNTARPPKKGVGVSKLARVLSISARRVVPIRSVSSRRVEVKAQTQKSPIPQSWNRGSAIARIVRLGLARRVDLECCLCRVASIWSAACVASRRFGRFGRFGRFRRASCRFRRVDSVDFGRVASRFADFLLAFRPDSFDSVDSVDSVESKSRRKHKKSPIPQSGNRVQLSQGVARS